MFSKQRILILKYIWNESSIYFIYNRPFPSYLVPLFQNESQRETFHMKMNFARSFIFMQIKVIVIRMVLHLRLALKQRHKGTSEMAYYPQKSNTTLYIALWTV